MYSYFIIFSLTPLVIYFLLFSYINGRRRPVLLSGVQDTALLCFAVCGMFFSGPVLFLVPINALMVWKIVIWPVLLLFYFLVSVIISSSQKKYAVLYNCTRSEALEMLEKVANWEGYEENVDKSLVRVSENIYLTVKGSKLFRNVSFSLVGNIQQSQLEEWRQILFDLRNESEKNFLGWKFPPFFTLSCAFFLSFIVFIVFYLNLQDIINKFEEFLSWY